MEGLWLWICLIMLFLILTLGTKNEWEGIRFILKHLRGEAIPFPRERHRGLGRACIMLSLLWGILFVLQAPILYRQFRPGFNAILVLVVMGLALFMLLTGWLLRRGEARWKLMLHQAAGYALVVMSAGLLMLLIDENFFQG